MNAIACICFSCSGVMLVISLGVLLYTQKLLTKCTSHLYFAWDLIHNSNNWSKCLIDKVVKQLEERQGHADMHVKREGTD